MRMVTLTHQSSETRPAALQKLRDHWKGATTAIRWYLRACRKLEHWEKATGHPQRDRWLEYWQDKLHEFRRLTPVSDEHGRPLEETRADAMPRASHWDNDARRWPRLESLDYIKVVEVSSKGRGYHAHLHVIVASQLQAEILNAAWQQTRGPFQPVLDNGQVCYCQTKITGCKGAGDGGMFYRSDAAAYVCKYIAKALASEQHRGIRWLDAGGEFRPLGLRLPPCEDEPVLVYVGSITALPEEFFAGRGHAYHELARRAELAQSNKPPDRPG